MPTKTIYVPPDDVPCWERFADLARRQRHSVSSLLALLVGKYVSEQDNADAT